MKISAKQYAQGLLELSAGKSKDEIKELIARFTTFLYRRQDFNKAHAIISELENLYDQEAGLIKAELVTAHSLPETVKKKIGDYLARRADIAKVELKEELDENLIGGFILRYNGLVIDGSIKNNLLKFKKQLSN